MPFRGTKAMKAFDRGGQFAVALQLMTYANEVREEQIDAADGLVGELRRGSVVPIADPARSSL